MKTIPQKIKVLYILNSTIMGGANISFLNMIEGLYEKGIEIYVVHPDKKIDELFKKKTSTYVREYYYIPMHEQIYVDDKNSIKLKVKNLIKKIMQINRIQLYFEARSILRLLNILKPDIVHTNCGVIHCGYYASKRADIPHVWHLREYQTKDFGWTISTGLEKYISLLHDSYVITITKDIQNYFELQNYSKAWCVYNGCYSSNEISSIYPKEKYFLCCSRISREKCQDDVIRAFSQFYKQNMDYKLIIAGFGDEEYVNKLRNLTIELGCCDAVEFIGFKEDVRPYMDRATALIVASRFEGFGRMTAEAAFRGCITIGRATGGTKEIIDITGGFLFTGDYIELSKKMNDVIQLNEKEYNERMRYACNKARSLFSSEQVAENIYCIYQTILSDIIDNRKKTVTVI